MTQIFRHTRPGIGHVNAHHIFACLYTHRKRTLVLHGFHGVSQQVADRLFNFFGINFNVHRHYFQLFYQFNTGRKRIGSQNIVHVTVDFNFTQNRLARTHITKHLADNTVGLFDFRFNNTDLFFNFGIGRFNKHFNEPRRIADHRKRVADLVADNRGHLSHGSQAFIGNQFGRSVF